MEQQICGRLVVLEGHSTTCGVPIPRELCPFGDAEGAASCPFQKYPEPEPSSVDRDNAFAMNEHDKPDEDPRIEAVRALHAHQVGTSTTTAAGFCVECRQAWPCATQQALGVKP